MAEIVPVAKKLQYEDVVPNYEYTLQGVVVNEEASTAQKTFLSLFIRENFEVIENQTKGMSIEQIDAYLKGAKDMLAFVNLWIDSLNTLKEGSDDITE